MMNLVAKAMAASCVWAPLASLGAEGADGARSRASGQGGVVACHPIMGDEAAAFKAARMFAMKELVVSQSGVSVEGSETLHAGVLSTQINEDALGIVRGTLRSRAWREIEARQMMACVELARPGW